MGEAIGSLIWFQVLAQVAKVWNYCKITIVLKVMKASKVFKLNVPKGLKLSSAL